MDDGCHAGSREHSHFPPIPNATPTLRALNDRVSLRTRNDTFSDLVTIKLHACHSTWYFQPVRMRFRRTLKGSGAPDVITSWRPYYGLHFDDTLAGFVVLLNPEGTWRLSSSCHQPGRDRCRNCAQDAQGRAEGGPSVRPTGAVRACPERV